MRWPRREDICAHEVALGGGHSAHEVALEGGHSAHEVALNGDHSGVPYFEAYKSFYGSPTSWDNIIQLALNGNGAMSRFS